VTRARKQNGVETVASRFLQRLAAVAPEAAWSAARERGARYVELARALERPKPQAAISRPAPKPPVAARPMRLSVTEIETLVRDPYSIYARHVLRLDPLDAIDADPGAAERGTILHKAFSDFARKFPETLPANALDELLARGQEAFAEIADFPNLRAFWWPRFERAARWFIGEESERRKDMARTFAEVGGKISFDANGHEFTLTARADRIDLMNDKTVAIADYKSGEPPTLPQILSGLAPQLALEAAIAQAGGFAGVAKGAQISEIAVIRVSGGHPAGDWARIDLGEAKLPRITEKTKFCSSWKTSGRMSLSLILCR
jgi:ATP-dependent helicase/nuclease subunit B